MPHAKLGLILSGTLLLQLLLGCLSNQLVQAAGVVGNGTAASCTETAFDTALAGGGAITFNCGSSLLTITLTVQKTLATNTTIDGGNLVTLSGGDKIQLFQIPEKVSVTMQNVTITKGNSNG